MLIANDEPKVSTAVIVVLYLLNTPSAELEAVLIVAGAIVPQRASYDDRKNTDEDEDDDDEEDDDPSSWMRSAATSTNAKRPKNIRTKGDDSDFEFDL